MNDIAWKPFIPVSFLTSCLSCCAKGQTWFEFEGDEVVGTVEQRVEAAQRAVQRLNELQRRREERVAHRVVVDDALHGTVRVQSENNQRGKKSWAETFGTLIRVRKKC